MTINGVEILVLSQVVVESQIAKVHKYITRVHNYKYVP